MAQQAEQDPDWIPRDVDLTRPSIARIYDYLLGGYHNFEVDRTFVDALSAISFELAQSALINRAYLRRAASFVSRQGIDQFLDLGSGIPTVGNLHEIVRQYVPEARVVYVDVEPVAVAHSEAMLRDDPYATAIWGDVRRPHDILYHPTTRKLIDFSRPVGLFAVALLHYIPDDEEAVRVIQTFKDALAPGSYLSLGVWTYDDVPRDAMEKYALATNSTSTPARPRDYDTVLRFFDGVDVLEPGVVHSPQWRPDGSDDLGIDEPGRSATWVGVAIKR